MSGDQSEHVQLCHGEGIDSLPPRTLREQVRLSAEDTAINERALVEEDVQGCMLLTAASSLLGAPRVLDQSRHAPTATPSGMRPPTLLNQATASTP